MTGIEKAAIFLLSIGENAAAEVMRHLDESTVNALSVAMSQQHWINRSQSDAVAKEFLDALDSETSDHIDSFHYVREVLDAALGETEAARVMDYIMRGNSMSLNMDIMREANPALLAEQLSDERPQAIALILAHLDSTAGPEFLAHLPESLAQEVLYRYASLDTVSPHVLTELGAMLSEQLSGQIGVRELANIGGPARAANLLNNLGVSRTNILLDNIAKDDPEMAESIRDNMFTFVDLLKLTSRDLQTLLREVPLEDMIPALKAATPEVVDRILENVSSRAGATIREELETGPTVRRSSAENAQKLILQTAHRLDEEGVITIRMDEELL